MMTPPAPPASAALPTRPPIAVQTRLPTAAPTSQLLQTELRPRAALGGGGRPQYGLATAPSDENPRGRGFLTVYTIVERGPERRHWLRIGIAFVNRDGSLNVRLDAIPANGQLHIREAPLRDESTPSPPTSTSGLPGD
jgi:hypothetical protein